MDDVHWNAKVAPLPSYPRHIKALTPVFAGYGRVARQCAAEGTDYPRYLLRLAELELIDRERRMVERRIKAAKFPTVKSLDSFDFAALPSLNKALVMELARSEYVERRETRSATLAPARATSDWGWDGWHQFGYPGIGDPGPWGIGCGLLN